MLFVYGLLITGIILFVIAGVLLKHGTFKGSKTECATLLQNEVNGGLKNGDKCAIWDGSQCRKGTYMNGSCTAKGNYMVLVCGMLGFIARVSSGVLAFINHRKE